MLFENEKGKFQFVTKCEISGVSRGNEPSQAAAAGLWRGPVEYVANARAPAATAARLTDVYFAMNDRLKNAVFFLSGRIVNS